MSVAINDYFRFGAVRRRVLLTCTTVALSAICAVAPAPAAAQETAAHAGRPPLGIPLLETTWRFMDASGASFTARFEFNGTFDGPADARLWWWEIREGRLLIVFDNGMGTRIVREGRFIDPDWLNGEARTADGRSWTWVAHRVDTQK